MAKEDIIFKPLTYQGITYPSREGYITDNNGVSKDRTYFRGFNGQYYAIDDNGNAVPMHLNYSDGNAAIPFQYAEPISEEDGPVITPSEDLWNDMREVVKNQQQIFADSPHALSQKDRDLANYVKMHDLNQRKQALTRVAGYDVPDNGIWNDEQQACWDKLTIKSKEYDTTLTGFGKAMMDKLTGNTTYRDNPLIQDAVQTYNPDNVDWYQTAKNNSPVVKAIDGTWGPIVMAALGAGLGKQLLLEPGITTLDMGLGYLGGMGVDAVSEAMTGRDFGTNMAKNFGITPGMGEMLNPGYGGLPRGLAIGDALITASTGKSRSWMKPLVRKYLGEPYYANIRPSGYGNSDPFGGPSRNRQYFNMFVDFLKPTFLRGNVNDPNYKPTWMADRSNPTAYEIFRNDAHRLSMGLKPHQELLPDGQYHSLYIEKPDGKYDVNWKYIKHVKEKYPDKDNLVSKVTINPEESKSAYSYLKGSTPSDGSIVSNDHITTNGGYGTYTFNPNKVFVNPEYIEGSSFPSHASTGDVKFTDIWDVQPLIDERSIPPWLSKSLTRVADKKIPVISKWAQNLKNTELVNTFGGIPFTQESLLPDQTIYWYPTNK